MRLSARGHRRGPISRRSVTLLGSLLFFLALAQAAKIPIDELQHPITPVHAHQQQSSTSATTAADTPLIQSSISGLYVNAGHRPAPPSQGPSSPSPASHSLSPITLYFDTDVLDPRTAIVTVSVPRRRTWEDVTLKCGVSSDDYPVGGIESCERDDLAATRSASDADSVSGIDALRCELTLISDEQGALSFDPRECPSVVTALSQRTAHTSDEDAARDELLSFTFTVTADVKAPGQGSVSRTWWVGHLRYQRAKWPLSREGEPTWDGTQPNKVSGLFHDPFIPRAAQFDDDDDLKGVDIQHSYWSLGISIRIPEQGLGDELEPVHAPVGGEVVWIGRFRRPKPPAPENDEKGWTVMIRDEWGFVWQLFRLAKHSISVAPGDLIPQGHIIGSIPRAHLSARPPVPQPPADPPLTKPDKGTPKYPFRFRTLQVNVVRPNAEWEEWTGPYVDGWSYYNPMHFLSEGSYAPNVPPYADPPILYFARPSQSPSTPPLALLSTNDVVKPILTGDIEILTVWNAFLQSPIDPNDGMDAASLYALEWAVLPVGAEEEGKSDYAKDECVREGGGVKYQLSFEHAKFAQSWNTTERATSQLFAHYVPTFTYGALRWTRKSLSSQFDEKARTLIYAPTRVSATTGEPEVGASWNTRLYRNGMYWVSVRARDYWGQVGCVTGQVRIFNL
ncbi:hypothetical protein V8E36_002183 [Tilletia maclaganii]